MTALLKYAVVAVALSTSGCDAGVIRSDPSPYRLSAVGLRLPEAILTDVGGAPVEFATLINDYDFSVVVLVDSRDFESCEEYPTELKGLLGRYSNVNVVMIASGVERDVVSYGTYQRIPVLFDQDSVIWKHLAVSGRRFMLVAPDRRVLIDDPRNAFGGFGWQDLLQTLAYVELHSIPAETM